MRLQIYCSITAIKYLFKYVYKKHDRTISVLQDESKIEQYINARYVSAPEGC